MGKREVPMSFRWSRELVERVDAARGDVPRARFVERALEAALGNGFATASSEPAGTEDSAGSRPAAALVPASPRAPAPARTLSGKRADAYRSIPKKSG